MFAPKKCKRRAGVANIPAKLLMTALHSAVATFPPEADVRKMHMFIVVGRQLMIKMPSSNDDGNRFGMQVLRMVVTGSPTSNGQATKLAA